MSIRVSVRMIPIASLSIIVGLKVITRESLRASLKVSIIECKSDYQSECQMSIK